MAEGTIGSMIGHLREFSLKDSDWTIFKARLENYFAANDIKVQAHESKMRAILLNVMDQDAYKLIADLVSPEKPEEKPYGDLIESLDEHFQTLKSPFASRMQFYSAWRESDETPNQWAVRLRGLAVGCSFGSELEVCLRDRFIFGFGKGAILDRLMEEKVNVKFKKVVEIAVSKMAAQDTQEALVKMEPINHIWRERRGQGRDTTQQGTRMQGIGKSFVEKLHRCDVCGRTNHLKDKCFFKHAICYICKKPGHLASLCKNSRRNQNMEKSNSRHNFIDTEGCSYSNNENVVDELSLHYNECMNGNNFYSLEHFTVQIFLEGFPIKFQVDTGSAISCFSYNFYIDNLKKLPMEKTDKIFVFYNGDRIRPIGCLKLKVKYRNEEIILNFFVISHGGPPILGRDFLTAFNVGLALNYCEKNIEVLLQQYPDVFDAGLGKFNKGVEKIYLKENVIPKCIRARPVPFAIREQVEKEIERLLVLGVISPVEHSSWATPIVPVFKKNGQIRICADFKVTLNPHILVDQHPLPRIDELFIKLQGGGEYTKLDLSQAFQQIEVDEQSRELLTISTHLGLFRYNRLTFGVSCAPAKFQKIMDNLFSSMGGVAVFQDDILVTGKTRSEHLDKLKAVLDVMKESGLKVNYKKCQFFQKKIEYLGFVIDQEGLHPSEEKTKAIDQVPRPENVKQLQSFLGGINYYGRFLPNMSTHLSPLYSLLKSNTKWNWNSHCEKAFNHVKTSLKSASVLVHYNPDLELRLTTDASSVGIGVVLSHKFPNGDEKPIAFASKTLSSSEQKYSQIEKEALSIIYGVSKFNQYLYGNKFKLITDHKPLVTIFGENKSIPQFSANRLRRWALILTGYNYEIEYVTSDKNKADWLSRLPSKENKDFSEEDKEFINYFNFFSSSCPIKLDLDRIEEETDRDPLLNKVKSFIYKGWPRKCKNAQIQPYFAKRFELVVKDNLIFWNHRLVMPFLMQKFIVNELHNSHMGVVRMKRLARGYFWFPGLDKEIEKVVKECEACIFHTNNPVKAEISPWPIPTGPWERIHVDFCELDSKYFIVVVDAFTKWLEACEMPNMSTNLTIQVLRRLFSTFGLPKLVVSDNGRSFVSENFERFLSLNNVEHITSPPYSPSSNGAAENGVKTFKNGFKKAMFSSPSKDLNLLLCRFLFDYRNTEHSTTGVSPAELMFGRKLRTRFSTLLPSTSSETTKGLSDVYKRMESQQKIQVYNSGGKKNVLFSLGETVLVKNYKLPNKPSFVKGKIVKIIGACTYIVEIPELGKRWKRHVNQIKRWKSVREVNSYVPNEIPSSVSDTDPNSDIDEQMNENDVNSSLISKESPDSSRSEENLNKNVLEREDVISRPKRNIKPVQRLSYN